MTNLVSASHSAPARKTVATEISDRLSEELVIALFAKIPRESRHPGQIVSIESSNNEVASVTSSQPLRDPGSGHRLALRNGLAERPWRIVQPLTAQLAERLGVSLRKDPDFHSSI